ncbi:MAG TPA: 16S rRNA (adenine(1518)-N(6)/adenine(1519)-N(6))-dimethyltransferase RsmA [Ohtaekwangia sp.]|uniref:16S rRNA (adenine(1518)-N(6)/adenine(1519)-N(6))- dimethyltransferase RsmA n=1 Tax=Ohtaekwangia sp. TaxID=2066019 RepID=UPI002F926676
MEKSVDKVRAKKSLGQHFLHDQNTARRIVESLTVGEHAIPVLEIGPGMGVLTQYMVNNDMLQLKVVEIDRDSVKYLHTHYPLLRENIIEGDFLEMDLQKVFNRPFSIIGNFPYNISSQIFFKVLEHRDQVDQVVCMLQKEVAERIAEKEGSKTYGILSVLLQAYYNIQYLFKVPPGAFTPPPKVMSAVIRLERNATTKLACDEKLFVRVVKQGFNNRRKTLRNALKPLELSPEITSLEILDKRAEQLSVDQFVHLTQLIEKSRGGAGTGI